MTELRALILDVLADETVTMRELEQRVHAKEQTARPVDVRGTIWALVNQGRVEFTTQWKVRRSV